MIRSHTTESKTKTNKGYEEHKLKLALQQSSSNSSKSSKNDSLKRPPSYNTVTGGTTSGSGLGSGAQVISSREFDQMRRNSQSIGESRWEYYSWTPYKTLLPNLMTRFSHNLFNNITIIKMDSTATMICIDPTQVSHRALLVDHRNGHHYHHLSYQQFHHQRT